MNVRALALARLSTVRPVGIDPAVRQGVGRPTATMIAVLSPVPVGLALSSPMVAVVGPIGVAVGVHVSRGRTRRSTRHAVDSATLDLADRIAQRLRAGTSLANAVLEGLDPTTIPELDHALEPTRRASRAGERLGPALRRSAGPEGSSLDLLLAGLEVLLETGGPAALAVDRLGDTLRAAASARAETRAQASQAVASATLLASLPFVFALVVAVVEPAAAALYLRTWIGAFCLATAAAAAWASWWWIDRSVTE